MEQVGLELGPVERIACLLEAGTLADARTRQTSPRSPRRAHVWLVAAVIAGVAPYLRLQKLLGGISRLK